MTSRPVDTTAGAPGGFRPLGDAIRWNVERVGAAQIAMAEAVGDPVAAERMLTALRRFRGHGDAA